MTKRYLVVKISFVQNFFAMESFTSAGTLLLHKLNTTVSSAKYHRCLLRAGSAKVAIFSSTLLIPVKHILYD